MKIQNNTSFWLGIILLGFAGFWMAINAIPSAVVCIIGASINLILAFVKF